MKCDCLYLKDGHCSASYEEAVSIGCQDLVFPVFEDGELESKPLEEEAK